MIRRGPATKQKQPCITFFDSTFLISNNMILRLQYEAAPTSYRRVTSDSSTEAIGRKHPYVDRNSATYYKEFSIRGFISFDGSSIYTNCLDYPWVERGIEYDFLHKRNIFMSSDKLYGNEKIHEYYTKFYYDYINTDTDDYIKEREFREEVINFLYDNEIFLFKTLAEGNTLVKLMDINLQPKEEIGNLIYSFTATALEMDEPTLYNLYLYNVLQNNTVVKDNLVSVEEDPRYSDVLMIYEDPINSTNLILTYADLNNEDSLWIPTLHVQGIDLDELGTTIWDSLLAEKWQDISKDQWKKYNIKSQSDIDSDINFYNAFEEEHPIVQANGDNVIHDIKLEDRESIKNE